MQTNQTFQASPLGPRQRLAVQTTSRNTSYLTHVTYLITCHFVTIQSIYPSYN